MPLSTIASKLPLDLLINLSRQRLICPTYHSVSDKALPHLKHLYQVRSVKKFEQDLDFLLKHYTPLSYQQLLKYQNEGVETNSFFLSFDDGFREIYDVVLPILKRKGVPAMVFLNTDFVDNRGLMYRCKASLLFDNFQSGVVSKKQFKEISLMFEKRLKRSFQPKSILNIEYQDRDLLDTIATVLSLDFNGYLKDQQPYLTSSQIKELSCNGFAIGAHSADHPRYSKITFEEQCRQTEKSLEALHKFVPKAANAFAFPFTDFGVDAKFFNWLYSDKINKVDASFGVAGIKEEANYKQHFHRIPMEKSTRSASEIIAVEYLYYLLKGSVGKNVIHRK